MKTIFLALVLLISGVIFLSYVISGPGKQSKAVAAGDKNPGAGVSVLELFTSQGCSSCPPADRLLGKYANMQNVIALSYHVDYWNRLGWKDPFSTSAFSRRQTGYGTIFKSSGIYTPQLIINGEREMVGSDEKKIMQTLKEEQVKEAAASVRINESKTDQNKITISYSIQGNESNAVLNIALVQNKITTSVKTGENSGADLTNYNVVRNFKSVPVAINETNTTTLDMINGADKSNFTLIAFLQNPKTYKIFAATKLRLQY